MNVPKPTNKNRIAGRYEPLQSLGEGGMGSVFLVRDLYAKGNQPKQLALKFISGKFGKQAVISIQREFAVLSQLRHPHLVRVFEFGFDENRSQYFFTSEWVDGKNLEEATSNISFDIHLLYFAQICDAVHNLHTFGFLHNDLKLSNILVDAKGVKILDFGLSSELVRCEEGGAANENGFGTPAYMAPELFHSSRHSVASDIFALGVVFFRILSHQPPFPPDFFVTKNDVPIDIAAKLGKLRPDIPPSLVLLVKQMLHIQPDRRPNHLGRVIGELEEIAGKTLIQRTPGERLQDLEVPLIGRDAFLTQLQPIFSPPSLDTDTTTRFVIISGPPGIGKTRLLSTGVTRLHHPLCRILMARSEQQSPSPYEPFSSILQQIRDDIPAALFESIAVYFPHLQSAKSAPGVPREPNPEDRIHLYHSITEIFRAISQNQYVLLVIDAIDMCDPDGIDLLQFLVNATAQDPFPLNIFATGNVAQSPYWRNSLEKGQVKILDLPSFSPAETRVFLQYALQREGIDEKIAFQFHQVAEGNPDRLRSILVQLANRRVLNWRKGVWDWGALLTKELKKIHALRLQKSGGLTSLSKDLRHLLEQTTLFPDTFRTVDLLPISEISVEQIHHNLREAQSQSWIAMNNSGAWQWQNMEQRNQIAATLDREYKGTRKKHHHLLAQFFEDEGLLDRAFIHWQKAGNQLNSALVGKKLLRKSLSKFAFSAARSYLNQVSSHAQMLSENERVDLGILEISLATASGRSEEAEAIARKLVSETKDPLLRQDSRLKLCEVLRDIGRLPEVIVEIENNEREFPEDRSSQRFARFLALKGYCQYLQREMSLSKKNLDFAIELLRKTETPLRLANVLMQRGIVAMYDATQVEESRVLFNEAQSIFTDLNAHAGLSSVYYNLALLSSFTNRVDDELAFLSKALHFARSSAHLLRMMRGLNALGNYYLQRGKNAAAAEHYRQSLRLANALNNPSESLGVQINMAHAFMTQGLFRNCNDLVKELVPLIEKFNGKSLWYSFRFLQISFNNLVGDFSSSKDLISKIISRKSSLDSATLGHLWLLEAQRASLANDRMAFDLAVKEAEAHGKTTNFSSAKLETSFLQILQKHYCSEVIDLNALDVLRDAFRNAKRDSRVLKLTFIELIHKEKTQETQGQLEKIIAEYGALIQDSFDLQIDVAYVRVLFAQKVGGEKFFSLLREMERQILRFAEDLDENLRQKFLGQPYYTKMFSFLGEVRAKANLSPFETDALRSEVGEKEKLIHFAHHAFLFLEKSIGLDDFTKALMNLLDCPKLAFFIFQQGQYIPRMALDGSSSWDSTEKFQKTLSELEPVFLTDRRMLVRDNFTYFPVFSKFVSQHTPQPEELLFGVFVYQSKGNSISQEGSAAALQWFSRTIDSVWQKQGVRSGVNHTRSLSSIASSEADPTAPLMKSTTFGRLQGLYSEGMRRLAQSLVRISPSEVTVLLQGETGTGKELIARTIHDYSLRSSMPFVAVNCGAIAPQLAESVLFGHRKGAFTDATDDHEGLLMQGNGGTVFLDEIGDLPLPLQVKLLRAIENREIRPVGSGEVLTSDFRLIAATHCDLKKMVLEKTFREDLFFRISTISLIVPPLRDRKEDIPHLVDYFLQDLSQKAGKKKKRLAQNVLKAFLHHTWPGNIRQLKNILENTFVISKRTVITVEDLPSDFFMIESKGADLPRYKQALSSWRASYIDSLLHQTGGSVTKAASMAGIPRTHFYQMMKQAKRSQKKT